MSDCCRMRCLTNRSLENQDEENLIHEENSRKFVKDYESLDYDECFNEPYQRQLKKEIQTHGKWLGSKKEILSWIVIFFVGVCTALVAFFIDFIVKRLSELKLDTVNKSLLGCDHAGCVATSLFILLAINVCFVTIAAAFVVFGEPLAAGSGIPEIKCYLNGVKVRNVVRFKTLVSKALGVLFSVSGGLLVGKEGPMIHSGGVIGAGIPQFQSLTFKRIKVNIPYFRSDRDKRDFVSAGAAAGVAAAFGAPIGGVLFSLEEGSSFWNQSLTWKTLFCTMASSFTLNFFLSGVENGDWGTFDQNGLLTFGVFKCASGDTNCHLWSIGDLLIFIVMGFLGGLLGALFNAINTKLTLFRLSYLARKGKMAKIFEVILIGTVTALCAFFAPMAVGTCKPVPSFNSTTSRTLNETQRFLCDNDSYNDMATLMYNTQETAIKQLFHNPDAFSLQALALFFVLFFFLSCWTYGSSVPSGLFVPCILCGASYGRFVASMLTNVFNMNNIYLGTYSLVGAAAFLGGVVRMTISLTVILIECTNEITYAMPIMVTLMVAKWAGDIFNHGIYDIHVFLKGVPLLEWDPPHGSSILKASDIMQTRLNYIYPHTRLRSLVNLLRTTAHNAFPVITIKDREEEQSSSSPESSSSRDRAESLDLRSANKKYQVASHVTRSAIERRRAFTIGSTNTELMRVQHPLLANGYLLDDKNTDRFVDDDSSEVSSVNLQDNMNPLVFHGIILRSTLTALLKHGISYDENNVSQQLPIDYKRLQEDYPRFPDIHDLDIDHIDLQRVLDVTPYMNTSPYVVYPSTQLSQVFNLFRTMGLRHLPVINSGGEVVGVITRHDLTHDYIEEIMEAKQRRPSMRSLSTDRDLSI